ncbi:MAG TPA: glycosyltransferase, partial [Planctomycetota bacterium]|nr:glycosyltransferase [Planctomycetota bacterium]
VLVGVPALRVARRAGVPLVYEVRDLWENASVDRGKFGLGGPFYRLARAAESRVLRGADAVVTICGGLRDELAPRVGRPGALHVVPNGVDADLFAARPPAAAVAARWGLAGKRVIAYVGTFQPYEGLDALIRALPAIAARVPAAHLLIAGSGGEERALRALTAALGLEARVTFTGRVPHAEVVDLYALADLLVYPRILTRTTALTTPLKPLEAMAMGRAVLVSDVPAMRELVRPGVTGLAFRAGDVDDLAREATRALEDGALAARLGAAARDWVLAERQWSTLVPGYGAIYEGLLAARAPGA